MSNATALIVTIVLSLSTPTSAYAADSDPQGPPARLRCEFLVDPACIDQRAPRLSWEMTDERRGAAQTAYRILVANSPERLEADDGNLWDSGRVASDQSIHIEYRGKTLGSRARAFWKVCTWSEKGEKSAWSEPASWSIGLLEPGEWSAKWIGEPAVPASTQPSQPHPPALLRKEFAISTASPIRATAYVSALGLYELRLNGKRVGDHVLAPEWTDYRTRVQYQTIDVTSLVKFGPNAVAATVADGWYSGRIGLMTAVPGFVRRGAYGTRPRLLCQIELEFDDGHVERIVTDGTWKLSNDGPLRAADLLDGETHDARKKQPGWDFEGFDDRAWQSPLVDDSIRAKLVAQPNEPIRVTRDIEPLTIVENKPGVFIVDFGQNLVGWCRLSTRGPAGSTITLRHAEVLNPDGSLYTANLRAAAQTDRFTLEGDRDEAFEPQFTYHGFRYAEIAGVSQPPTKETLTARVVHSAPREVGEFECSVAMLNRLWRNILWTQRGNMHSTPTDCPQRDERCGWMGDILAFASMAGFNMDMAAFYTKWLADVRDAQASDGRFPDFAPHPFDPNRIFSGVPGWGDAGVVVPWVAYEMYADRRLLEQHYDAARRWVEWIRSNNPDLLWKNKRHNDYGDWLNADTLKMEGRPTKGAEMPKEAFGTAFFYRSTDLLSRIAAAIGRDEDAKRYAALAADIRTAFIKAYVQPDGKMLGDTQAGYAIALHFGLIPDDRRAAAVERMIAAFDRYDGLLSTGFHSTVPLMWELTNAGRTDLAYKLIGNRKMPSWGYEIDQGATTIWERWDGFVAGRGFQDPGMNSFAHYALGSVGEWMMGTIVGIHPQPLSPGFKRIRLAPQPGGDLTWARGAYESIHGRIEVAWKIDGDRVNFDVRVPANTTATLRIPTSDPENVQEGGSPAAKAAGVRWLERTPAAANLDLVAGRYTFVAKR